MAAARKQDPGRELKKTKKIERRPAPPKTPEKKTPRRRPSRSGARSPRTARDTFRHRAHRTGLAPIVPHKSAARAAPTSEEDQCGSATHAPHCAISQLDHAMPKRGLDCRKPTWESPEMGIVYVYALDRAAGTRNHERARPNLFRNRRCGRRTHSLGTHIERSTNACPFEYRAESSG